MCARGFRRFARQGCGGVAWRCARLGVVAGPGGGDVVARVLSMWVSPRPGCRAALFAAFALASRGALVVPLRSRAAFLRVFSVHPQTNKEVAIGKKKKKKKKKKVLCVD
eukprot:Opistho-1_new@26347